MGIRFSCPNGHKLHVKEFLAGKRGICPSCGAKFVIPETSAAQSPAAARAGAHSGSSPTQADLASQSIIISLVEPSRAALAPAVPVAPMVDGRPAADLPMDFAAPPAAVMQTNTRSPHPIAPEPRIPDASLPARRTRSRRNQTTLAIALLLAVIVLGIVLVWVLTNQSATTSQETAAALKAGQGIATLSSQRIEFAVPRATPYSV